jgi:hypothetical protein
LPRPGIIHIFFWMSTTAAYLAVMRILFERSPPPSAAATASLIAVAPIHGAFLAGFVLFTFRWLRGRTFAREPGDWLLVANGAAIMLMLLGHLHGAAIVAGRVGRWPFGRFLHLLPVGAEVVILAMAARHLKMSPMWCWVLRSLCLLASLRFVLELLPHLPAAQTLASLLQLLDARVHYFPRVLGDLIVACAAAFDISRKSRRSWTHWFGIAAVVVDGMLCAVALSAF